MATYDLLIFDLDGTLVPTEQLATRLIRPLMLEHLGVDLTDQEVTERYRGRDLDAQFADMEELYGASLPQTFLDALDTAWIYAVKHELAPSTGVVAALEALDHIPRCVASNSWRSGVDLTLKATGLDAYFSRSFSADDVTRSKPAPDLFLFAASEIGVTTDRCLVIEDTVLGVIGAKAAGMAVIGYVGNDPSNEVALSEAGAEIMHDFSELAALVTR